MNKKSVFSKVKKESGTCSSHISKTQISASLKCLFVDYNVISEGKVDLKGLTIFA